MLNTFQNKQHTYYHWFPLFSFSILYKSKKYYSMYSWLFSKSITILVNEMCSCLRQYWIVNSNSFISHLLGCKQFYSKVQGLFCRPAGSSLTSPLMSRSLYTNLLQKVKMLNMNKSPYLINISYFFPFAFFMVVAHNSPLMWTRMCGLKEAPKFLKTHNILSSSCLKLFLKWRRLGSFQYQHGMQLLYFLE